jgi:7-cyano-7-deazaguanine synthase
VTAKRLASMLGGVTALLLSGGMASACVAAWRRPEVCLFVDYGQASASSARAASRAIAHELGTAWVALSLDWTGLQLERLAQDPRSRAMAGLLFGGAAAGAWPGGWPYRNQLLVTVAAAWAGPRGYGELMLGAGHTDAEARPDGNHLFFRRVDQLVRMQPGGLRVTLPALGHSLAELVQLSGARAGLLRLTYACEVAGEACGSCAGCLARARLTDPGSPAGVALAARQR